MSVAPSPKDPLTSKQRKQLRGLAHDLAHLVTVGKEGITPTVIAALVEALLQHELVKVRVLEAAPIDRKEAAPLLAEATGSHDVGTVGRIVILYRRHPKAPKVPLKP